MNSGEGWCHKVQKFLTIYFEKVLPRNFEKAPSQRADNYREEL